MNIHILYVYIYIYLLYIYIYITLPGIDKKLHCLTFRTQGWLLDYFDKIIELTIKCIIISIEFFQVSFLQRFEYSLKSKMPLRKMK